MWRVADDLALAVTVDLFTPVVDDPYTYGAIAAANSLSDIYAMGGQPFLALNILGVPAGWPVTIAQDILRGGAEKVREAGALLAGGHSLQDEEPKYGLVALGWVHPSRMLRKDALRAGDYLVLTKPLGTGTITTALKRGRAEPEHVALAERWMARLNAPAARVAVQVGVRAATDVTGFGLLGHAWDMARSSNAALELVWERIPFLNPALGYARQGIFPGGTFANQEAYREHVTFDEALEEFQQLLLFDAQTSGGLLLGVPRERWEAFQQAAREQGLLWWWIGQVREGPPHIWVHRLSNTSLGVRA